MNWDEDIDLLAGKKSAPRQGRRTTKAVSQSSEDLIENDENASVTEAHDIPIRTRKTGVWSEEGNKSFKSKGSNLIEQERFHNEKTANSDDDIPTIPDIDDIADDSLNLPDVKPVSTVDKSTYKELDSQFENFYTEKVNFGSLDGIDLSFLTNKLYPEKDVQPNSEIWTMESLFEDISRNMNIS